MKRTAELRGLSEDQGWIIRLGRSVKASILIMPGGMLELTIPHAEKKVVHIRIAQRSGLRATGVESLLPHHTLYS
jgi:hypothetical protein